MKLPINSISFSFIPLVVTAGAPIRIPLVTNGDNVSNGIVFLFVVIFALSLIVCFILISNFGINGGVYSYATIMLIEFLIYVLFFRIRIYSLIKGSIS